MLNFTLISRLSDALPLAASMDNTADCNFTDPDKYKLQAKNIFKELSLHPPPRLLTIDSGDYSFHLLTENGVCLLTICEGRSPSYIAFSFLEDLNKEFQNLYGSEVSGCERPYKFIKFDTFLQKTKKVYVDSRTSRNLGRVANRQNVTKKNIREVLGWVKEDLPKSRRVQKRTIIVGVLSVLIVLLILWVLTYSSSHDNT
jgi:vesicle transport protein SEC22